MYYQSVLILHLLFKLSAGITVMKVRISLSPHQTLGQTTIMTISLSEKSINDGFWQFGTRRTPAKSITWHNPVQKPMLKGARDKEGAFFGTLVLLLFSRGVAWVHPLRGRGGGHWVLSETEMQIYQRGYWLGRWFERHGRWSVLFTYFFIIIPFSLSLSLSLFSRLFPFPFSRPPSSSWCYILLFS